VTNSDLPVKLYLTFTTLAFVLMQYVKVFKLGMTFLSSLASLAEFLNEEKSSPLKLLE